MKRQHFKQAIKAAAAGLLALALAATAIPAAPTSTLTQAEAATTYTATRFVDVEIGDETVGAIDEDGNLWMWGENDFGQVGNGTTEDVLTPQLVLSNVAQVCVGRYATAAIDTAGNLWIWGTWADNLTGDYEGRLKPTKAMSNIKSVALGDDHGAAVDTAGNLWTWGDNSYGQLADGTTVSRTKEWHSGETVNGKYVPGYYTGGQKIVQTGVTAVFASMGTTGYVKNDGSLWLCGENDHGQIGNGYSGDSVVAPFCVLSDVDVASVSMTWFSGTMALTTTGDVYTWGGHGDEEDLGRDADVDPYSPVKVLSGVAAISKGYRHMFAIMADGSLYACGESYSGQLFNGSDANDARLQTFTKIRDAVKDASAGGREGAGEFSAYIDSNGALWMVGANDNGQLGNGTTTESIVPVQITGTAQLQAIGDVNGNGAIEAADALLVLQQVVQLTELTSLQITSADTNGNGSVEATDALLILQRVVNLISSFPAEG